MTVILIILAAALGTVGRAWLSHHYNGRIALGVLYANIAAAALLGFFQTWNGLESRSHAASLAIQIGLLGALSTWSSLAHEVAGHLRARRTDDAAIALGLNLVLGVAAAWLGLRLGRVLNS